MKKDSKSIKITLTLDTVTVLEYAAKENNDSLSPFSERIILEYIDFYEDDPPNEEKKDLYINPHSSNYNKIKNFANIKGTPIKTLCEGILEDYGNSYGDTFPNGDEKERKEEKIPVRYNLDEIKKIDIAKKFHRRNRSSFIRNSVIKNLALLKDTSFDTNEKKRENTRTIIINFNKSQKKCIEEEANRVGLHISTYIRRLSIQIADNIIQNQKNQNSDIILWNDTLDIL